eukprot:scaffold162_cov176-Amphora_coffeaeformis.AAC.56
MDALSGRGNLFPRFNLFLAPSDCKRVWLCRLHQQRPAKHGGLGSLLPSDAISVVGRIPRKAKAHGGTAVRRRPRDLRRLQRAAVHDQAAAVEDYLDGVTP